MEQVKNSIYKFSVTLINGELKDKFDIEETCESEIYIDLKSVTSCFEDKEGEESFLYLYHEGNVTTIKYNFEEFLKVWLSYKD